jgi:hypothetical protein
LSLASALACRPTSFDGAQGGPSSCGPGLRPGHILDRWAGPNGGRPAVWRIPIDLLPWGKIRGKRVVDQLAQACDDADHRGPCLGLATDASYGGEAIIRHC